MTELRNVNRNYKVGTVLASYDLVDLHEELPALWVGEAGEEASLRDLAERINIALVERALEEADEAPLDGEAENIYRLLTDDAVSAGVRTQQRNRLKRAGVDVDQLETDFVTHQAVHTYLTKGLGVSKDTSDDRDPLEKHATRIQRLRNRLDAVLSESLSELQSGGEVSVGELDTAVGLQVYCQDCETQYEFSELLEQGECNCESSA